MRILVNILIFSASGEKDLVLMYVTTLTFGKILSEIL